MSTNSVAVRIADKEYRIRSDADEEWLQRVAHYVDASFRKIRERTRTVDSLDVAVLAALNLGRELIELREGGPSSAIGSRETNEGRVAVDQLAELIDFVESELSSPGTHSQLDA
jgi:cell division protein ZapA